MSTINECLQTLRHCHDIVLEINCNYTDINAARIDLYSKLKNAYRETYADNQRLVFVLEHDMYNTAAPAGSLLQAIQIILQDIDISNFFVCIVTTNPDISTEYNYIQENISSDTVGFHVYPCTGNFSRLDLNNTSIEGKIQSLKNVNFDQLSDNHQNLLFNNSVFCLLPWLGINVDTNSRAYPCCEFKRDNSSENVKTHSIDEIWNSDSWKSIRKSMLNNQPVQGCQTCYFKEQAKQNSLRINFNREFSSEVRIVDQTHSDGGLSTVDIKYWDIRYNNLCNFACRSCHPAASTSWYQVHNSINPNSQLTIPLLEVANNQDQIFEQISKNINTVSTIYFAGGEPSMIKNFYKILELLIENQRQDVKLRYNINMSR